MIDAEYVTRALGGRWSAHSGSACCPAHEDRTPSLSIANGHTGQLLLTCHAGCSFEAVLTALKERGVYAGEFAPHVDTKRLWQRCQAARLHNQRRSEFARSSWDYAIPVQGTLAERYLRARGITCVLPKSLRYLATCWHPKAKRVPALIGQVTHSQRSRNRGFAVHRTYLDIQGQGKAALTPSKAMLGATKGGAVRLSLPAKRLVVTEGIETGLSLLSGLIDGPIEVWAALSAGGMQSLNLPRQQGVLLIAPDGDDVGRAAAEALATRAHGFGWQVSILAAPQGSDWNDVLLGKAQVV
ncbi:toprim domain-containing protein [Halocynthiibacter sp. C4]|uniref:DUF7146 domain-containing protein n=1 Tax=Halocynthiibacter sp. C4 TaxID=2992758 RepID=UPI00237AD8AB|nr:toprim domain-containing protein [Halocynthiibacter sp. C4]MDE0589406.1 toprim domain-containing protein [Halocynthiibacter sp. C4]